MIASMGVEFSAASLVALPAPSNPPQPSSTAAAAKDHETASTAVATAVAVQEPSATPVHVGVRRLLVFVNPVGGAGKAVSVYEYVNLVLLPPPPAIHLSLHTLRSPNNQCLPPASSTAWICWLGMLSPSNPRIMPLQEDSQAHVTSRQ